MSKSTRHDSRNDADRKSVKLTLRLPRATAEQLYLLAKRRGMHRVAIICDLIEKEAKK